MTWAGHVAYMGKKRNKYRLLVQKPEGKRSLVGVMHRNEDNIKMSFKEMG
jgi:hypothetical protein